jgi:hypothetical protein
MKSKKGKILLFFIFVLSIAAFFYFFKVQIINFIDQGISNGGVNYNEEASSQRVTNYVEKYGGIRFKYDTIESSMKYNHYKNFEYYGGDPLEIKELELRISYLDDQYKDIPQYTVLKDGKIFWIYFDPGSSEVETERWYGPFLLN